MKVERAVFSHCSEPGLGILGKGEFPCDEHRELCVETACDFQADWYPAFWNGQHERVLFAVGFEGYPQLAARICAVMKPCIHSSPF